MIMKKLAMVVAMAAMAGGTCLAEEGFVRAVFQRGMSIDATSSIWEAENATVVTGVDDFISEGSYDFPEHTTYAYGAYMYVEADVVYCIRSYIDDNMLVKVDDTALISTGSKYYAAFRYVEAGWHKMELRFFNNTGLGGGSGGLNGCTFCGADGVWKRFSTANGQFRTDAPEGYVAAAPTIVYRGSGSTINVSQYTGNDLVIELLEPWTGLPNNAFKGNILITSVKIIGSGEIGTSAFEGCTALTRVEIFGPTIGASAFKGCASLSDLTLNCSFIGNNAFQNCSGLTGVLTIPESVTSIGGGAFAGCSGITGTLAIPSSVTTIGSSAFSGCTGLTGSLMIPGSVTTIGRSAFSGCTGLTGSLMIPGSVTMIGSSAFSGCTGLTGSLMIGDGVTSIGEFAFDGCSGLTGPLTIPNSVTNIARAAFRNCSGFTGELIIPPSVKTIGGGYDGKGWVDFGYGGHTWADVPAGAFSGCSGFTGSLAIPEGVTSIEGYVFFGCRGFTGSLTIPNGVMSIGDLAFWDCRGFTGSLTIPSSVETIGVRAFEKCSGLTGSLTIPDSVVSMGSGVFSGCSEMNAVRFLGPPPDGFGGWGNTPYLGYPEQYGAQWRKVINPYSEPVFFARSNVPLVEIVSSKMRVSDPTVMDIVYKVTSVNPTVKVRVLAFQDGIRSLANIIRPETFVDGTEVNVGDSVTANVEHTISWKVSADWSATLARVKVEVLAVEDAILPLELRTLPADATHPTVQFSWNVVDSTRVYAALLWLYADRDVGLTLRDGVLYAGSTRLAGGTTCSNEMYDAAKYVYGKMGFGLLEGDMLEYVRQRSRLNLPDVRQRQYAVKVLDY